jgi:2-polyprenyl-3-methyl-5-hydroxy-6-metoxy-1,4-benzoquinol methylase
MVLHIDPEKRELRELKEAAIWRRKRVVEIGCGDGRLTERLANLGARIDAIDPEAKLIRAARRRKPARLAARIRYHVGKAEHLPAGNGSVDRVVFAWSL